jgi:hypothetical protein
MNQTEIDKMEAGREMDALVAEKVLGCKVENPNGFYKCGCGETCRYPHAIDDREGQLYGGLLYFSTDISAAWKLCENFPGYGVACSRGTCICRIYLTDDRSSASVGEADTVPLAICRAALKAVGVN